MLTHAYTHYRIGRVQRTGYGIESRDRSACKHYCLRPCS